MDRKPDLETLAVRVIETRKEEDAARAALESSQRRLEDAMVARREAEKSLIVAAQSEMPDGRVTQRVSILRFLRGIHPRSATHLEIAQAIGARSTESVRQELIKLADGGYLERPARGVWVVDSRRLDDEISGTRGRTTS